MIGAHFRTAYDEPQHVLDLPADVTSGKDAGISFVDQVVRGTGIVGRVTGDFGAVALKVRGTGGPMSVQVAVHLDELGTRWWSDRVKPSRLVAEKPRLMLLRSQGVTRGAVLLARRQGWRGAAGSATRLTFDLTADELDGDGLLVVELAEPALPGWARDRISVRSALGVRIDGIAVRPRFPALPAGGGGSGCDLAIVAPESPRAVVIDLLAVSPAPPLPRSPSNRWTRRKPARAAFKATRIARRLAVRGAAEVLPARTSREFDLVAADLTTGEPIPVRLTNGNRLHLPTGTGPILLGLRDPNPGLSLRVRPC